MPSPDGERVAEFLWKQNAEYQAALIAHADVVVLCAGFYVDIANLQCRDEFILPEFFMAYVEHNRSDLKNLAKAIDGDIKMYWQGSLTALLSMHEQLRKEYTATIKKVGGKKA